VTKCSAQQHIAVTSQEKEKKRDEIKVDLGVSFFCLAAIESGQQLV